MTDVIKLYRKGKPNKPEFYILVKAEEDKFLVNYPIELTDRKRHARWFNFDEVYIDWVREFA